MIYGGVGVGSLALTRVVSGIAIECAVRWRLEVCIHRPIGVDSGLVVMSALKSPQIVVKVFLMRALEISFWTRVYTNSGGVRFRSRGEVVGLC